MGGHMRLRVGTDDAGVGAVVRFAEDVFFVLYVTLGFIVLIWLSYGTAKLIRWVLFRKEEKKWQ